MEVLLYDSTICRLCAQENSNGIIIFNNPDTEADISKLINKYLPLKVFDDGKFPCSICPGCNIQLESTMEFLQLIIAGQAKLRDLYKQQQEYQLAVSKGLINSDGSNSISNIYQTMLIKDENDEIVLQFLHDGNFYNDSHELFLSAEGIDKPRKKRGRPPKQQKDTHHVLEAPSQESKENEILEEDVDGRTRRRRKVPSRYREAVQGKELERMFREEGVIDDDSPEEDAIIETEPTMPITNDSGTEVIGHLQTPEGQNLGDVVMLNSQKVENTQIKRYKYNSKSCVKISRLRKRRIKYCCDICGKGFIHLGRYNVHRNYHHKKLKYECENCQEKFDTKLELETHHKDKEHTGEKIVETLPDNTEIYIKADNLKESNGKISCTRCSKTFLTKQGFEVHMKGVHEKQRPHICDICNKSFAYIASLKSHLMSHKLKANKGFPCDICGKVLNHPSSIIYHKQAEHNNGRRFVCSKCNKSFKHKQLLQRHQLVHTSARPFECNICNAQFKAKSNLLNHQSTHTGIKKYFCEQCNQQFAHKTSLTLHYRWHSGQKPFSCVFCDKSFSQNGNLQEHMRIHTGVKPYCCNYCGRHFTTSSQYKLHIKRHTGERPWTCEICMKSFLSKETWKSHSRRHLSLKPFCCTECNRGFTEQLALKKHLRVHTGEKPYVCDICDRAFSDCSNLSKHKKIHNKVQLVSGDKQIWNVTLPNDGMLENSNGSVENKGDQIYYVTYEDNNEDEGKTIQLIEDLEDPLIATPERSYSPRTNLSGMKILEQQIIRPADNLITQMEVTDEHGNPIKLTTNDGQDLQVSTFDGEHLQVTTPDGTIVPIELSLENGQTVSMTKSTDDFIVNLNIEANEKENEIINADESQDSILVNETDAALEADESTIYVQYITSSKEDLNAGYINLV